MYFLLDTNVLIAFIREAREEYLLDHLIALVEEGSVQIVIPDVLMKEWEQKRKQTLDQISKTFSSTVDYSKHDTVSSHLETELTISRQRAEKVDSLLAKGIKIKATQKVKVETVDRSTSHKAPFHDNMKGINDALIYFSTIEFLKTRKINSFVFVTKNVSDFGDPQNKVGALHPDLLIDGIETLYFPSLGKCFQQLQDELRIKLQSAEKENKYQIVLVKRKAESFLKHLYDVLSAYRQYIEFLPTHLLSRLEPFRIVDHRYDYAYHSGETLYTNNTELFDFFASIDIAKMRFKKGGHYTNTKTNLEQLDFIIAVLNHNLVLEIGHVGRSEKIAIRKELKVVCNCARCTYNRLEFGPLLSSLNDETDLIKKGFILSQLGKYGPAFLAYHDAYKTAIKEKRKAAAYRLLLTLQWVISQADYQTKEIKLQKAIQEIKKIDAEGLFLSLIASSRLDRELALFLEGSTTMDYYTLKVREHTDKIRQHYHSQLKANYSSNSNYSNMAYEFVNYEMFTVENGMAYTQYSEHRAICDDFVEGIFISYALNEYQAAGILHFDDFVLEKLLFYGDPEKMIRLFNRYIQQPIKYKSKIKSFENLVVNFLETDETLIVQFSESGGSEGSTFYRFFWNIVLLLALVDFNKTFVSKCTDRLIPFLEKLPKREARTLHHLASVLNSKAKRLNHSFIRRLFKLTLSNPLLHHEDLLSEFSKTVSSNLKLIKSEKEFDQVCLLFLDKCPECGEFHKNAIFRMHPLMTTELQKRLAETINDRLASQFDHELYYLAVLYDIIDYKPFFEKHLTGFRRPVKLKSNPFFHYGEIDFRGLNNLMNLVFKTKATLPKDFINNYKGLSPYYDWLLDMEHFDYKKFNPLWIIQYATSHYLQAIFSIEAVRVAVRKYLRVNPQPTLAYYYTQYVK